MRQRLRIKKMIKVGILRIKRRKILTEAKKASREHSNSAVILKISLEGAGFCIFQIP